MKIDVRRLKLLWLLPIFLLSYACSRDLLQGELTDTPLSDPQTINYVEMPSRSNIIQGVLHLELRPEYKAQLQARPSTLSTLMSASTPLAQTLKRIHCTEAEPLFPADPRFEERHKAFGLDRWYKIRFTVTDPLYAKALLSKLSAVATAEECYRVEQPKYSLLPFAEAEPLEEKTYPFNDPKLPRQWHYQNDGSLSPAARAGADINLFSAWQEETGKPNVIVAITDGGVDWEHEDLAQSMWVNIAERDGQAGKDDDGNGYVDDVYGYSFVYYDRNPLPPGRIPKSKHGTHVGGTIAARNGNGIGVCGVAGGNGDPQSGVRIMSLCIFRGEEEGGNSAATYVYGADNGAVISQNSWGFEMPGPPNLPKSLKLGIDYFIEHAGCDKEGNQLPNSPMKGGVVIFAAGNDNEDYISWPGAYEATIAVSSMAWDFSKAFYTTRGKWVDIMAPGGDTFRFGSIGGVLSTIPGNNYAYEQGTSMACPHVSGIAGLVVSKFGGPGFTNTELFTRLTHSLRPVNIDQQNPGYEGRLGLGYIDAAAALSDNTANVAPEPVTQEDLQATAADVQNLYLRWRMTRDANDGTPIKYRLYIHSRPLDKTNYLQARLFTDRIMVPEKAVGDIVEYQVSGLEESSTYYFALLAEDRWESLSEPFFFSATTTDNPAPEAPLFQEPVLDFTTITLKWAVPRDQNDLKPEKIKVFSASKPLTPENYKDVLVEEGTEATLYCTELSVGDQMTHIVRGLKPNRSYYFALQSIDKWGKASSLSLASYQTLENTAPIILNLPEDKLMVSNVEEKRMELEVSDKEQHSWEMRTSGTTKGVSVYKQENKLKLTIRPILEPGDYSFTIHLKDELGAENSYTIAFSIFKYLPPRYTGGLENMMIGLNDGTVQIELDKMYEYSEHYTLSLKGSSTDGGIAFVEVTPENVLKITPHKPGTVKIKISSSDGIKEGKDVYFDLRVVADSNAAVHLAYPIPAKDYLNLLVNSKYNNIKTVIRSMRGELLLEKKLMVDHTHTARLFVKNLAPGKYILHVKAEGGKDIQKSFIKK